MTEYAPIETTGHIKQIEVLGTDPLSGNVVIELFCGQPQSANLHRVGAFSIAPDELKQFLRQAADELAQTQATTIHNA